MDLDNLKRAWRYGLRLMVLLAVNSEYLCAYAKLSPVLTAGDACEDRVAIPAQLTAAQDLEREIDAQNGGTGKGWFHIALTPADARRIISEGKLAVVLGVESANAFGCKVGKGAFIEPADPIFGVGTGYIKAPEFQAVLDCSSYHGPAESFALFEKYWALGARHFFPVHNFDGVLGGTALSVPILHAENNPSGLVPGTGALDVTSEINRLIRDVRPPIERTRCAFFDFDGGVCNSKGLAGSFSSTDSDGRTFRNLSTGAFAIRFMASYGAMIDTDHMSRFAALDVRMALGSYPTVRGHTNPADIAHGSNRGEGGTFGDLLFDWMLRFGGIAAPILHQNHLHTGTNDAECDGTTESFISAYRYYVKALESRADVLGRPLFVGIPFGSDFNGLAGWPAPRFFGGLSLGGGGITSEDFKNLFYSMHSPASPCYALSSNRPRVSYPFESPLTHEKFEKSVAPWSGAVRPFDISVDGVAHVGMIPDMVEEMRVLGVSDTDLQPLFHGAEAYIRSWQAAQEDSSVWQVKEGDPSIREACRSIRVSALTRPFDASETTAYEQKGCLPLTGVEKVIVG